MIDFRLIRSVLILFLICPVTIVIGDSLQDFHEVRGREAKSSNLALDQVVVTGNTVEFKNANHDGFYSITFDSIVGATGIEFEWINEVPY